MPRERGLEGCVLCCVGLSEGHEVIDVLDDAMDGSGKPADQLFGAVGDGVEHRLHIIRRSGNDLQYLGRRCLLLTGFLQVFGDRTTLYPGGRWRNARLGLDGLAALCWACV